MDLRQTVSQHAETLNILCDMQQSIAYACRRDVLEKAERIIVEQEAEIKRLRAALAAAQQEQHDHAQS